LVIDLGDTAFIDLAGMEAIAQAHRDAPPGCQIVLRSPNGLARRVIELTGMDQICLVD
jgi:anti-anti-sigma regulatory factor